MSKDKNRNNDRAGRKRRLWPVFSIILVLCYLAVSAWFIIYGFGEEQEPDGVFGSPTAAENPAGSAAPPVEHSHDAGAGEPDDAPIEYNTPAVKVRGLYINSWKAGMADKMDHYIELCDTTEINALVIDVKDDSGQITFLTDTEGLSEVSTRVIPRIENVVSELKSHGIYTIARIVCLKDNLQSSIHPGLAIQNTRGEPWKDNNGISWLNPYNTAVWDYLAAVSLEAARVGFDEVQLDYVRFPSDGNLWEIDFGAAGSSMSKTEIISELTAHIRAVLAKEGVRLSADVFGIIAISDDDAQDIGQDLGLLLDSTDYICPMIYPSHFANKKQNGRGQIINDILFEAPDLEPYEVVYNILLEFKRHLDADSEQAIIRPYLQDFTAGYLGAGYYQSYGPQQVRDQIRAVYDAGFDEWILWSDISEYNEGALELIPRRQISKIATVSPAS